MARPFDPAFFDASFFDAGVGWTATPAPDASGWTFARDAAPAALASTVEPNPPAWAVGD